MVKHFGVEPNVLERGRAVVDFDSSTLGARTTTDNGDILSNSARVRSNERHAT